MPIDLKDVNSGYNLQTINDNFQTIESKWDEKLDRLSSEFGNEMKHNLDMNGVQLINAYVGDTNISRVAEDLAEAYDQIEQDASDAKQAAEDALKYSGDTLGYRNEAESFASAAESSAASVVGITTLPVLEWQDGTTTTNGSQRYLFNNTLFIAPSATVASPVSLGVTPVGDVNWTDWSLPVYAFSYEEVLSTPKQSIQLPISFYEVSDVYVGGLAQPLGSYSIDTNTSILTFSETIPANTFIKVWTGRPKEEVLEKLPLILNVVDSVGQFTKYSESVSSPATIFKPGIKFTTAEISINGVVQIEGSSYTVEVDDSDSSLNQLNFSEDLPAGATIYGILRSV